MFAMWLTIVAPVVSQTVAAASWSPDLGSWCGDRAGLIDHSSPQQPSPHAPTLEKCGYCGLLGHSPTLAATFWLPLLPTPVASMPTLLPERMASITRVWLAAAPRGPPAFPHA
nr:DUF2946 domain-containing protein [Rhodanobacter sp. C05]